MMRRHVSIATLGCFFLVQSLNVLGAEPQKGALISAREVGEVDIRNVLPISAAQREKLARFVAAEPAAKLLLQERVAKAKSLLETRPQPLAVIHYEGLVNTDPRRIEAVQRLKEMDDAALLFEVWQATGNEAFAAAVRRYILAWSSVYKPTGNDVNENKLQPLFVAYGALRAGFSQDEQRSIEAWLRDIAERQIARGATPEQRRTNRHTKRLRIVATIGLALQRKEWMEYAEKGFKEFVSENLYADGTSFDLHHRDTLTYHCSALQPLLDLAILAFAEGRNLYDWSAPSGSSLKKSVDYVVPFATGEKTRREWTNSKVDLDRRRAAAGLDKYQPGSLFKPQSALPLLEEAAFFDASLQSVIRKVDGGLSTPSGSWRAILNQACR